MEKSLKMRNPSPNRILSVLLGVCSVSSPNHIKRNKRLANKPKLQLRKKGILVASHDVTTKEG